MRYSTVEGLVPDSQKQEVLFRYYESLRTLGSARTNPLFWLQYAVAATVFDAFDRAAFNFKTAYSLAEKSRFEPYQIDNHYARFLLRRASKLRKSTAYMEDFRAARRIIESQMRDERQLNFPFRVARLYVDFSQGLRDLLTPEEHSEVKRAASAVLEEIESLADGRQNHYDVRQCARDLKALLG